MQRLLGSQLGILGSYVAFVAAVSLIARWQIYLSVDFSRFCRY